MIEFRYALLMAAVVACATHAAGEATSEPDGFAQQLGGLINDYRTRHGVAPLVAEDRLAALARQHSATMASAGRMSHDGFQERFQESGHAMCVENVGWNYPTPAKQLAAWEVSPGHERNMTDTRVTHMGIGVVANYVTFIACR